MIPPLHHENFTWETALETVLGATDSERRLREILATEANIERHLMALNGISSALVTLDIPLPLVGEDTQPPTAVAVLVTTQDFSPAQGYSLAVIMSRSVGRLEPENIVIIDHYMRPIWDSAMDFGDIDN